MVLKKLAISNFLAHRVRVVLTVAAVALSVSLVVSVTTGYHSIEATALKMLNRFMGSMDAQIYRRDDTSSGITQSLVDELRRDPDVSRVLQRLEVHNGMLDQQ